MYTLSVKVDHVTALRNLYWKPSDCAKYEGKTQESFILVKLTD